MSLTGKNTKSIRKQDVKESRSKATGFTKLTFAHKATAGETGVDLGALVTPTEMSALGFTNPSAAQLLEAKLFQFKKNLTVISSSKGVLMQDLSYRVASNSRIVFEGFTAEEGEIFTGIIDSNPVNGIEVIDAKPIAVTGTLAAGQTDVNFGTPVEKNKYGTSQVGAVMLFIDGVLQTRNSNNSDTNLDGNYHEFGSGSLTSVLRMNTTSESDREFIVVSNGVVVASPQGSAFAEIEKVQGQIDAMIPDLAQATGNPETDYQAAPNSTDLKTFGDRVIAAEDTIEALLGAQVPIVTEWTAFTPDIDWANTTVGSSHWRRVGSQIEITIRINFTGAGEANQLEFDWGTPLGLTRDSTKMPITGAVASVGFATYQDSGSQQYWGNVGDIGPTTVGLNHSGTRNSSGIALDSVTNASDPFTWASGDIITLNFSLPIVGWEPTQTLAEQLGL